MNVYIFHKSWNLLFWEVVTVIAVCQWYVTVLSSNHSDKKIYWQQYLTVAIGFSYHHSNGVTFLMMKINAFQETMKVHWSLSFIIRISEWLQRKSLNVFIITDRSKWNHITIVTNIWLVTIVTDMWLWYSGLEGKSYPIFK